METLPPKSRTASFHLLADPLVWVAAGLFILYLTVASLRPEGYFWTIDEGGKFTYLQSTLKTGDPAAPLLYPGQSNDPLAEFVPLYYRVQQGDQFYTWWGVGFPLFSLPFYRLFGWLGIFILPALSGSVIALLTGLIVRRTVPAPPWLAPLAALLVGLTTPVAFYSVMFWEHTLAVAFGLASIWMLIHRPQRPTWIIAAAICSALAIFFRTETVFILLGVGIVLLVNHLHAGITYAAATAVACIPWISINWYLTGHPLNVQFANISTASDTALSTAGIKLVPWFLINVDRYWAYSFDRSTLIAGTILIFIAILASWIPRLRWLAPAAYAGLIYIAAEIAFSATDYRSLHGFWLAAPLSIAAAWSFSPQARHKKSLLPAYAAGGALVFGLVYIWRAWTAAGGLQYGPRYLLLFYPLLIALALSGLASAWKSFSRSYQASLMFTCAILAVLGAILQVRGIQAELRFLNLLPDPLAQVQQLDDRPVVSRGCELSMFATDLYWQGNLYSVTRSDFQAWVRHAQQQGIDSFYWIETDLCADITLTQMAANHQPPDYNVTVLVCSLTPQSPADPSACQPLR